MDEMYTESNEATALGPYAGYTLQTWHFLRLLLDLDEKWKVSLEVFEDVGAESDTGDRIALQTKRTKGYNPIADRSIQLWKTLSNWVIAVQKNLLDPSHTRFEIYVSLQKDGPIAQLFSSANTIEEAKKAILTAKKSIYVKKPAKGIKKFVDTFFAFDIEITAQIIKQFHLIIGLGDTYNEILACFRKKFLDEDILDNLLTHSLGWVKKEITRLIDNKELPIISQEAFRKEVLTFRNKLKGNYILQSLARSPEDKDLQQGFLRKYIQQLELIESEINDKILAVRDFFMASGDRTIWSQKGWVNETSFDQFEQDLIRTWGNLKTRTFLNHKQLTEIEKGQALYSECSLHTASLQGMQIPQHFTVGSFHALSDIEEIGWHPTYKELLSANDKEADKPS